MTKQQPTACSLLVILQRQQHQDANHSSSFHLVRGLRVTRQLKLVPLLDFVGDKLWAAEPVREVPPHLLLSRWREMGVDSALIVDERGEFPRSLFEQAPNGLALFAGVVPKTDIGGMPRGKGAIVDFWEVVPRKT